MPLSDTGLVVRYFLDEDAVGSSPTTISDAGPDGYDLTDVDYGSGNLAWVQVTGNRGLESSTANGTQRARRSVDDSSDALRDALAGTQTATFELVIQITAGTASNGRVMVVNDRTGSDPDIGISAPAAGSTLKAWWEQASIEQHDVGTGKVVVHVVYDSTEATATDRLRMYVDGALVAATVIGSIPLNDTLAFGTGRDLILLNRESSGSYDRSIDGALFYGAIYTDPFDAARVADHAAVLAQLDDAEHTVLFFGSADATSYSLGQFPTRLDGTVAGYHLDGLGLSPGASAVSRTVTTVAGPTAGKEFHSTSSPNETEWHYVTPPIDRDFTLAGDVTMNLWGLLSDAAVNAGFQVVIERIRRNTTPSVTESITTILNSEEGTELNTSSGLKVWTATPTSTAIQKGDRLRIRVAVNDAGGTMAAGTATFRRGEPDPGGEGESYIVFAEEFAFWDESVGPSAYQLFLRNSTPAGVTGPGTNTEYEMLLSRGGSGTTVSGQLNNSNGPGSPQDTEIEWYSDPLTDDIDMEGNALASIRWSHSAGGNTEWPRAALFYTDGDGANPVCIGAGAPGGASISTTETARPIFIPIPPVTILAGKRIRLSLYYDDGDNASFSTIATAIIGVNGPTAGAQGDSWLKLPVSLVPPIIGEPPLRQGLSPLRWR